MMGQSVGIIGLGAMGMGMAQSLLRAGFTVSAYDLSHDAMARARASGITVTTSPVEVMQATDAIVLSLPLARHVEETIEAGFAAGMFANRQGMVVIDTSTSEAAVSRRLAARLAEAGHGFLDAPVSGGPQGAANGALSMMIGGDTNSVTKAQPVLDAMAAKVIHVGDSGAGNIAKLVNNMLVACHMLTTAEALRLSEAAGLPAGDALRVINSATGRSALSEVHFPNWVLTRSFDSGFSAGLMRKDIRLALELATDAGCAMPVSELVVELWSKARSGLGDTDDFMLMGDPDARPKEETNG
ncbi:NAD(P)-dependent oxidoreductase [Paracoccus alkanivorans]|uniref:NAD(P)-dependent oxidoreductase n=1 Tax=Paracoccus alkanivorans TaxID=2116655 RepID=A0A3M0MKM1_9RHOB|nr:NAD(P)-dependent oxidoreductase [Paracoccus alkanivorans]